MSINVHGDDRDQTFPAWVSPGRWNGFAIPTFSRATAIQVVEWTNRLHADDPKAAAYARWDGEDVVLSEPQSDKGRPVRITPDEHGRYAIGDGWTWEEQQCWICHLPARPDENGDAVQTHESGCPTDTATDQWPLAAHDLI
ncbi:hypothetical protein [Kibdelosporangium phytohabitans]|uniref:Uncharacterized protein n=1 Tax=Kibdelosporangium phytohabitans TaxID=860235 RepID=A0A0N9HWS6_9PSEU|nr:hypothetical protein [Kibdelosporangium phytohabitans]ALG06322.1 hypothetical protein AOZ06_04740 [Kibdelosporangium phytohabitans]MBE1467450.1 hypothetical protein [Kibdelosporangium phytohabitans]